MTKKMDEAGPALLYLEDFKKAVDKFGLEVGKQKAVAMAAQSRLADLRNERERLETEVATLKDKRKAFEIELSGLQVKVEARRKELKELLNT